MYKSPTITAVIAAALVLSSATPAFAKGATRSTDAIPAKTAASAKTTTAAASQRLGAAARPALVATPTVAVIAPLSSTSALVAPAAVTRTPAIAAAKATATPARTTAAARVTTRPVPPIRLPGFGSIDRLTDLFAFLPPALQQVIADTLANAPGGGDFCTTLGIPGCVLPDSNG